MFLPILAVCILLTVSADDSSVAETNNVHLSCCDAGGLRVNGKIIECFEQKPRLSCGKHFFLVTTKDGTFCIKPKSKWLKHKIQRENLECPLEIKQQA